MVPEQLVVRLPDADDALLEQAACLGIPGITGYRAVFADGPVTGLTVLVHGSAGGVGAIATQMATRDGATVIGVVRTPQQAQTARSLGAHHVFQADDDELTHRIREIAPDGIHRIAEVDLANHVDLDAEVIAIGGVIGSYYSSADRTTIPYWPLGFSDTTLRLLGSDDFPEAVKADAARALTQALLAGALTIDVQHRLPLHEIARAHELVESGSGRVILTPPTS